MPTGLKGIAGSMLIVIFSYAGFEIIGLAASETDNPSVTIPIAIFRTVVILVGLYVVSMAAHRQANVRCPDIRIRPGSY